MLKDELVKKVIYEVLSWVLDGVTGARVVEYLRNIPDSYPEETAGITAAYIEARLIKYDDATVSKVKRIVQYTLPQYVYARMEGDDVPASVVRKLEDKYGVVIKQ